MAGIFCCVGKSLSRPDVAAKATGTAVYGADLTLPGMLIGRILASPHAHAKVVSIDTSAAKALPGVKAVITHEDVPKRGFTRSVMAEAFPSPTKAKTRISTSSRTRPGISAIGSLPWRPLTSTRPRERSI